MLDPRAGRLPVRYDRSLKSLRLETGLEPNLMGQLCGRSKEGLWEKYIARNCAFFQFSVRISHCVHGVPDTGRVTSCIQDPAQQPAPATRLDSMRSPGQVLKKHNMCAPLGIPTPHSTGRPSGGGESRPRIREELRPLQLAESNTPIRQPALIGGKDFQHGQLSGRIHELVRPVVRAQPSGPPGAGVVVAVA